MIKISKRKKKKDCTHHYDALYMHNWVKNVSHTHQKHSAHIRGDFVEIYMFFASLPTDFFRMYVNKFNVGI